MKDITEEEYMAEPKVSCTLAFGNLSLQIERKGDGQGDQIESNKYYLR